MEILLGCASQEVKIFCFLVIHKSDNTAPELWLLRTPLSDPTNRSFFSGAWLYVNTYVVEDKHPYCAAYLDAAMEMASRSDIGSVIIGAAWNLYFTDQPRTSGFEGFRYYYLKEDGENVSLKTENGRKLALESLGNLLTNLSAIKKVYLLLDNPSGDLCDPMAYVTRDGRLEGTILSTQPVSVMPGCFLSISLNSC